MKRINKFIAITVLILLNILVSTTIKAADTTKVTMSSVYHDVKSGTLEQIDAILAECKKRLR